MNPDTLKAMAATAQRHSAIAEPARHLAEWLQPIAKVNKQFGCTPPMQQEPRP